MSDNDWFFENAPERREEISRRDWAVTILLLVLGLAVAVLVAFGILFLSMHYVQVTSI